MSTALHIRSWIIRAPYIKRSIATENAITDSAVRIFDKEYHRDDMTNVTPAILKRVGRNLHNVPHHPINLIKQRIVHHFHKTYVNRMGNAIYTSIDDTSPVVTTEQNFDSLLVPTDHVCRNTNDNYYINKDVLLRAHTSAHQRDFIKMGFDQFLVTGDVYRRDEIDSTHYPVFHQMEGVRIYTKHQLLDEGREVVDLDGVETTEKQAEHTLPAAKALERDLKGVLDNLMKDLFGSDTETRWNPCFFPFTHPSYEMEVLFRGQWVEMLGSGIMRQGILDKGGASHKVGWAFGLGLDRLAMLLFDIPDIRLLWSEDERFLKQFENVSLNYMIRDDFDINSIKFKPFSKYPVCYKDVSFWINEGFNANDLYEVIRNVGGDLIEKVELIDSFTDPSNDKTSHCYRLSYRSMDRTVTNDEINSIQDSILKEMSEKLPLKLR
jgi:phenylalanyl-tRNA synthetase alpha chain